MKKYMRQMNRRNGNVFEKVKVLKDELSKIQCNLDKDPTNAVLKEEEMVYYSAYREAALDEEKLLKQKTKIEWLRDGDFNSSYFHSVVKGRTSRNRIEMVLDDSGNAHYGDNVTNMFVSHFEKNLGTQDVVYEVEDAVSLFTKRLDADKAMELIKDVTNEEIKEAIFSIEDNKASGPDGFSSKFFKAAWMVIGNDVCAAIKEFFTSGKLLGEFNTTLISLVPKSKTPARVIDYRQISYDLLMLCHGDVVSASILRVLIDAVKNRINDWRNKSLSFAGRLQLISSILSSLQVYWCSLFILPKLICETIDKMVKNFLWAREGNTSGMVSIGWKEVCKPKSQGGLGLKPLCAWNEALMAKHLWNIASNKDSIWVKWINIHKLKGRSFWDDGVLKGHSWVWAQLLDLRDRIKNYVNVRIGNGSSCNVWFDKWNSNGPLSKLIDHRTIVQFGFSLKDKVCDLIQNGIWSWPEEWEGRFSTVLDVPVPVINHNVDDKVYWVNKKGKEKGFSVAEVWKAIKPEFPKVIWYKHIWYSQCIPRHSFISWIAVKGRLKTKDRLARWFSVSDLSCHLCRNENESHSHLFFACAYSRRLWERLKPMGKMENISNAWANVISWISNKPASNKIWSIIQRLVFGAAIYFIWQERNSRIFQQMDRSEDSLFEVVVSTVRLRLRSLKLKQTPDVIDASEIWGLPIDRSSCGIFMKLAFSLLAQMDVCGLFHRWLTMIWIPVCYETLLFIHRSALINVMKIELASVYAPMFCDD
ncbi:RNA-directed DNA polymerase, eukaryota, reverse transcriptase zinc-binding domain protein [Tanacetum coccineum]